MPETNSIERQQFNVYLDREIVRALKLRCIQEDRRLNHFIEEIFAAHLAAGSTATNPKTTHLDPEPMKTLLPTVIVAVDDMDRSLHLYRDILGLPARVTGNRWTEFETRSCTTLALHIQDSGGAVKANGVVTLCLEVADLDDTAARLREAGYAVEGPAEMEGLGRLATFRDPDGVAVSLAQA